MGSGTVEPEPPPPDTTQLAMTKPQYYIGSGYSIDGTDIEGVLKAVPEPSAWLMLLVGFGGVGNAIRREQSRIRLAVGR